jgi:hypothetical protein
MKPRWNDTEKEKVEELGEKTYPIATLSTKNFAPFSLPILGF